ncbi:histidine kinase [Kribbella sp. NPDC056861]|uniref:sensor histidine kinase n=1 Tax=Kribbella sp. NPDC056861 TaxID=3154857 RepID=UPI0034369FA2
MEHIRNWLLPLILGIVWVAFSPRLMAWDGPPPTREQLVAVSAASVAAAVALGFRRRAPLATLGVVTTVTLIGQLATPQDGVGVLPADLIALYSVAVRRPPVIGWMATLALVAVKTSASIVTYGVGPDAALAFGGNLVCYVVVLGAGQTRSRLQTTREQTAQELRLAEAGERDAAVTERRRLARELHDVSAHHLTAIVVTGTAAARLADRRPELADEALTYVARTGQETLDSLHRLVTVLRTSESDRDGPLEEQIAQLTEAFIRLGQEVLIEVSADVPGPAGDAVFGIVRESLTNTLRYAPGATVRVVVRREDDCVELMVENDRPDGDAVSGHGSGRGILGMTDRAEAIGGSLVAGPGPNDGWQVQVRIPLRVGPSLPLLSLTPPRLRGSWRDHWLSEVGLAFTVSAVAVGGTAGILAEESPSPGAATTSFALLLAVVPGLALLGRRYRPWSALAGIISSGLFWPAAVALGWLPDGLGVSLAMCFAAFVAAVYAVAVYGRHMRRTWLAVPLAAGGVGLAAGAFGLITSVEGDPPSAELALLLGSTVGVVAAIPMAGCWVTGLLVRRRRNRRLDSTGLRIAELVRSAEAEVQAERQRIAGGLHHSVLAHASQMIALAEAGQLDGATTEARAALAAMRELLETLDNDGAPAPRGHQA